MIKTICNSNTLEITYTNNDQLAAHTCCIVHHSTNQMEIVDLFAVNDYKDMNFEDMLLEEILSYVRERGITSILVYVGPEPYNPDPYWSVNDYIAWYESYGFVHSPGAIDCCCRMVYQMPSMI